MWVVLCHTFELNFYQLSFNTVISNFVKNFVYNSKGVQLLRPEEILSNHSVEQPVYIRCNLLCFTATKCVGFYFRNISGAINCQLINSAEKKNQTKGGEWDLFLDVDAVSSGRANRKKS